MDSILQRLRAVCAATACLDLVQIFHAHRFSFWCLFVIFCLIRALYYASHRRRLHGGDRPHGQKFVGAFVGRCPQVAPQKFGYFAVVNSQKVQ